MTQRVIMGNYMFFGKVIDRLSTTSTKVYLNLVGDLYIMSFLYFMVHALENIYKVDAYSDRWANNENMSVRSKMLNLVRLTGFFYFWILTKKKWLDKNDCSLVWDQAVSSSFFQQWRVNREARSSALLWREISWRGTMVSMRWGDSFFLFVTLPWSLHIPSYLDPNLNPVYLIVCSVLVSQFNTQLVFTGICGNDEHQITGAISIDTVDKYIVGHRSIISNG